MKPEIKYLLIFFSFVLISCGRIDDEIIDDNNLNTPQNLSATKLEYANMVRITWDQIKNAENYAVYVYSSKADPDPKRFISKDCRYDYMSSGSREPVEKTPYFFKVAAIVNGEDQDKTPDFCYGLFDGSRIDVYEPANNDTVNLAGQLSTTPFDPDYPPLIYNYPDGTGGYITDIDWYKYYGNAAVVQIIINVPYNQGLEDDDLSIDIVYANLTIASPKLKLGNNTLSISKPASAPSPYELYFKIYLTTVDYPENDIWSYDVEIKEQ
jgi:hypothetical protein